MNAVTRAFPVLPPLVFFWMMMRAGLVFTPNAGRRDPRGLGIALSMWGTLATSQLATIRPSLAVQFIGAAGLLLSLTLYEWAARSIRGRLFSFAGNDDLPQFVHRSGPYAYVRNPFYLTYILAELSTVVMRPGVWNGLTFALAVLYFNWLARFEEDKFARSPVAAEYAEYARTTGRLVPRLRSA